MAVIDFSNSSRRRGGCFDAAATTLAAATAAGAAAARAATTAVATASGASSDVGSGSAGFGSGAAESRGRLRRVDRNVFSAAVVLAVGGVTGRGRCVVFAMTSGNARSGRIVGGARIAFAVSV